MTRHIVSSFVAGSLALALCACDRQDAAPEGTAMQMPATRVTIADMTPTTVTLTGEMAGRTVSYRQDEYEGLYWSRTDIPALRKSVRADPHCRFPAGMPGGGVSADFRL